MPLSHSNLLCRYHYDPTDRLSGQTRTNSAERLRFYSKNRLATEVEGALRHSIVQHDDWVLAQRRRQGDTLDSTLPGTDQQSSVLLTLKANEQPRHVAYSPYGHRRAENGLTSLLGFKGQRPDPVTGYYLLGNGYRAFNPTLMRFNSPDSLSPFGKGGLNAYAYCLWDPVNLDDPTGQFSVVKLFTNIWNRLFGKKVNIPATSPSPSPSPTSTSTPIPHLSPTSKPKSRLLKRSNSESDVYLRTPNPYRTARVKIGDEVYFLNSESVKNKFNNIKTIIDQDNRLIRISDEFDKAMTPLIETRRVLTPPELEMRDLVFKARSAVTELIEHIKHNEQIVKQIRDAITDSQRFRP